MTSRPRARPAGAAAALRRAAPCGSPPAHARASLSLSTSGRAALPGSSPARNSAGLSLGAEERKGRKDETSSPCCNSALAGGTGPPRHRSRTATHVSPAAAPAGARSRGAAPRGAELQGLGGKTPPPSSPGDGDGLDPGPCLQQVRLLCSTSQGLPWPHHRHRVPRVFPIASAPKRCPGLPGHRSRLRLMVERNSIPT